MEQAVPQTFGSLAIQTTYEEPAVRPAPNVLHAGEPRPHLPGLPPMPERLEQLGLPERFLEDLALKTLHRITIPTPLGVALAMHIPPVLAREAIELLKRQRWVETTSASGRFESEWQYRLTEAGMREAEHAFERSRYVGPVPVTMPDYLAVIGQDTEVGAPDAVRLARALKQLVLARDTVAKVCLALTSGRPAMLWGAPGNGKTTILELCSIAMQGVTVIPYAVFVSGHIIRMFDDLVHVRIDVGLGSDGQGDGDPRWVRIQRPFVFVGGELRPEDLDLAYDPALGFHQAPPHVKAHGGLLAIDDFGRQLVAPHQLLNRWIAALERGEDTMALITGERITVPFRSTICFSTNLDPAVMLEEAHLRRIPYKIRIPEPTDDHLAEMFRRFAAAMGVEIPQQGEAIAVQMVRRASRGNARSCHPRDVLQLILEEARFVKRTPLLEPGATRRACEIYFVNDPGPCNDFVPA